MKTLYRPLFLLAFFTLNGCIVYVNKSEKLEKPAYLIGFNDGCKTSTAKEKSFPDDLKYQKEDLKKDKIYASGFRQGFLKCKKDNIDGTNNFQGDKDLF